MKKQAKTDLVTLISQGWQASFNFFEPKEMTLLTMASLNTTMRALGPIARYFSWWLILWGCYIDLYVNGNALFGGLWEYARPMWYAIGLAPRLYVLTMMLITFVMVLSVRASLEVKKPAYFLRYASLLAPFALFYIVIPQIFVIPVFWFAAFFLIDSPATVKGWSASVYNGLMLWVAHIPFIFIMGALHGVLFHLHRMLWEITFIDEYHFSGYIIKFTTSMILYLFFVAMLGAFYLRVTNSNSNNPLFIRVRTK